MNVIDVTALQKHYGLRNVLDQVTFAVGEEEKVGLIGVNGSGKSTLLRILARLEDSDGGTIATKRGARIGYLPQEPILDDTLTVGEEIERGLAEIRTALAEFGEIARLLEKGGGDPKLLDRQGELSAWIEHHGGWNTDYRIKQVMEHLGLTDSTQQILELSGGTKRRVALARLLLEAPDLLLLDEPTNHLDAETTEWLQEWLKAYPGAVMLITHDRYFLDRVAGRMLELEQGRVTGFPGGYSAYLEGKEAQLAQEARAESRLLNLLRIETAWIRRGAKARTTKQKARIDRYQQLQDKAVRVTRRETRLDFGGEAELGGTILELADVRKGYGEKVLVEGLTFGMKRGDRVGIIGPNGCGKTTLLRMVIGEELPDSGKVVLGKKTRIAYFDQQRALLDPEATIYDFFGDGDYVTVRGERRHKIGYLEDFLFRPDDRRRKIGTLSGGEKSRLILARLMLEEANLLILDEPTNDLDIPTLQLLDAALTDFPGCVLVVTHDRFFLDKVATGILAFGQGGRATFYEGNYTLYRQLKDEEEQPQPVSGKSAPQARREEKQKPKRGLTYAERLELERVEAEIAELEGRKAEVERMLADPSGYEGFPGGIGALSSDYDEVQRLLSERYDRWEELELKKEEGTCRP
ncbi:ABC-F family ATP-binding cassette domain-containing protein [Geobacter sp. DSM 9736]|uniref:ABC-F family ATP-binding cassette domain-containing protein n=1 Tax=Geobacter sp. DSM 9736 TaxID=1277350 RepID=UPI000B50BEF5|nr:ABC-F family ATP-binding cassette domain-containing protein [Geobacter sp. DSM 9736]SNB44652.1 ATP-binding cassette, subfamily F, uup [Geobacter sp. DSM 9736]